jgi:hypothetical protein
MTKKRGGNNSLKKRGIGLKKKINPVFKSKLMEKQKKFLIEAINSARIQGPSGSTRTTDRSFIWDVKQKKSLMDLVNRQSCMYCDLHVAACASKTHQQALCVIEDVERTYQRMIETDDAAAERKRLESLAKVAVKSQKQTARAKANETLLALQREKISKIQTMKKVLASADEWMEKVSGYDCYC